MRHALSLFAALLPTVAGLAQQPAATVNPFVGTWQGPLEVSGMRLRLAFAISRDSAGALLGSLVSIDQGNQAIPATFTTRGDSLIAAIPAISASFAGVLNPARDSLRGSVTQGVTVPLN